jgi:hypothetical protein
MQDEHHLARTGGGPSASAETPVRVSLGLVGAESGKVEPDGLQVWAPPCAGRLAAGLRHTEPDLRVLGLVIAIG